MWKDFKFEGFDSPWYVYICLHLGKSHLKMKISINQHTQSTGNWGSGVGEKLKYIF